MLQVMRRYAQTWGKLVLWMVVIAFIGTIFVVWGMGRDITSSSTVATVRGTRIDQSEYEATYSTLYEYYRQLFRERFTEETVSRLNLRQLALNSLILRKLQLAEGKRLGITSSDEEVEQRIALYPVFQREGRLDLNRYQAFLRANRLTPAQFEARQREDLIIEKLGQLIKDHVLVVEDELRQVYEQEYEQIRLQYLLLRPELWARRVTINEKEVADYYQRHKEQLREPERRRVAYVTLPAKRFEEQVQIGSDEVEAFYREQRERFQQERAVRVRHLLVRVQSDEEQARNKAEALYDQLMAGADFANLAKRHSDDPASAARGGDLGYLSKGQTIPAFEEVAFSLKTGEVSRPFKTPYGYHLLKAEAVREGRTIPLEEAREAVTAQLRLMKAMAKAKREASRLRNQMGGGKDGFAQVARAHGLAVQVTDFFARQELPKGIPPLPQLAAAAFSLSVGGISEPIKYEGEGYYLIRLLERRDPTIPSQAQIGERLRPLALQEKALRVMREETNSYTKRLQGAGDLTGVARELGLQIEESGWYGRSQAPARLAATAEFLTTPFTLPVGGTAALQGREGVYLVKLVEKRGIDEKRYQAEKEAFRRTFLQQKREAVYQSWLTQLLQQAEEKKEIIRQGDFRT